MSKKNYISPCSSEDFYELSSLLMSSNDLSSSIEDFFDDETPISW